MSGRSNGEGADLYGVGHARRVVASGPHACRGFRAHRPWLGGGRLRGSITIVRGPATERWISRPIVVYPTSAAERECVGNAGTGVQRPAVKPTGRLTDSAIS